MRQIGVVVIHNLHLAPVKTLASEVNIRLRQKIEPELGFRLADIGNAAIFAPGPRALGQGIEHGVITKVSLFYGQSEGVEGPVGHRYPLDLRGHDLKDAGFEDHLRVSCVDRRKLLPDARKILQQAGLAAPKANAAPDVFCAGVLEHAYVVIKVTAAVEQALHRDGAGEIVVQHLAWDGAAEVIAAPVTQRSKAAKSSIRESECACGKR